MTDKSNGKRTQVKAKVANVNIYSAETDSNNIKFYGNFKLRLPIQLIKQDMSF